MCRRTLCTIFALLSLCATTAWADSQIRIVRLSYAEGDVQLDRHDGMGFTQAFRNLPIIEGARLAVGAGSHAEVEFEEGSTARLTPDSIVEFQELRRNNGGTETLVVVQQGEVYFNLKHRREDDFRVRAANETLIAKKDSHFRLSMTAEGANLAVFNGDVRMLRPNGQELEVRKHEFLILDFADADRYFLSRNITPDAQDDWDRQRESALEAQLSNYNSLNRYGSYITVANYGELWRPYGVDLSWDPYQSGTWAWYPGAGYVWVSSYPWGWAPYRYGNWIYLSRVGWCWRPAAYNYNQYAWNPAPVVVNPPTGYVAPVPPAHNNGIVIVGRRPNDGDRDVDLAGRMHPGFRGSVSDSDPKPLGNPVVNATTSQPVNGSADAPRPERARRDVGSVPITVQPVQVRPAASFLNGITSAPTASQSVTPASSPAASTKPRPSHVDRTPVTPPNGEPRGRSYTPPSPPAPTQQYTPASRPAAMPRYTTPPPAATSQPAARPTSRGGKPDPK